jgi:3-oxoacyl-(acyl-carrier-protein) synthase
VAGSARPVATLSAAMSNSFAFGGTNVSLLCRAVG